MKPARLLLLLALCVFGASAAYAATSVRDSVDTILNGVGADDARARFAKVYALLSAGTASGDETERVAEDEILPFVDREWKDDKQRLGINRSITYLLVAFAHRERGGEDAVEKEIEYMDKALEEAILSGDDMQCALCYNFSAYVEIKRGNVRKAHEYLYKAIEYYDRQEQYTKSSEMLYTIGTNFFEIKDAEGLGRVLEQMREYLKKDSSKQSLYQYNVLRHCYFTILQERDREANGGEARDSEAHDSEERGTLDHALVDSAMVYIRSNVALVENSVEELAGHWMHGYAYYYLAKELDRNYPEKTSEIFDAIDKALATTRADMTRAGSVIAGETNAHREFYIMVNSIRIRALFRTGRTLEARQVLDETMDLLAGMENYENLNAIRSEVYRSAVEINERTGEHSEALRFQKLLTANEARAHEKEKVRAINDMSAKYDTERGKVRIETLTRENRTARQILLLAFGLLSALVVTVVLVVLWNRQRRQGIEQKLYETALLAELHHEELEKVQEQGRQSEQSPVADIVEKIARQVEASRLDEASKWRYLDNLSHLDTALLENAYRLSQAPLTGLDMKYIVCFNAGLDVRDIGLLFNVAPASVNTVRYRIRKKFAKDDPYRIAI